MSRTRSNPERAAEVFQQALDWDPDKRPRFLERTCGADGALRAEVESLLAADAAAGTFLDGSALDQPPPAVAEDAEALVGKTVGPYRLIRIASVGGMSTVYLALRSGEHFRQRVAVKVIRRGMISAALRRRFNQERRVLARLEHAYITSLIDGGTTDEDLPYLVMEYVEGAPMDRYCDGRRLSITGRLELFRRVCEAVHYAHQNLIIHRDIKPSNILVTDDGLPKLLDFGISKLLDDSAWGNAPDPTITILRALTPRYASPEQVQGDPITTASDIYSLGVLLYELLTGHRPYHLDGKSTYEQGRVICEQEPLPPSVAVPKTENLTAPTGAAPPTIEAVGHARRERIQHLQRRLKGDLDNIILMALQKDPKRRYGSVQQLSDDIERYLQGLPVSARKDTLTYRAGKLIRRNKAASIASGAMVCALLIGILGTSTGLMRARQERNAAVQARGESDAVATFLQEVLADANPYRFRTDAGTLDQLLKDAEARIDTEYAGHPSTEAAVRYALANTYAGLWNWARAKSHLLRAVDLRRSLHGDVHPVLADCLILLGRAYTFLGDPEAVVVQSEALAIRRQLFTEDSPQVAWSKTCLGFALWRAAEPPRFEEAKSLLSEALTVQRRLAHENPVELAISLHTLAALHTKAGENDEGVEVFRESVEAYRELGDRQDRYMAECIRGYANTLAKLGRYVEAEPLLEEYVRITPPSFQWSSNVGRGRWLLMVLARHREWENQETGTTSASDRPMDLARQALLHECQDPEARAYRNEETHDLCEVLVREMNPVAMIRIAAQLIQAGPHHLQASVDATHLAALLMDRGVDRHHLRAALRVALETLERCQEPISCLPSFARCILAHAEGHAAAATQAYDAVVDACGPNTLVAKTCRRADEATP